MKKIDVRGLACPAPVLQTKDAIEKEHLNAVEIIVDNEAARQNVTRFLKSQKFEISVEHKKDSFHVIGRREGEQVAVEMPVEDESRAGRKKIMIMVNSDRMGHGDDELGAKLITSFLKTLKEMGSALWRLFFINNGVKLTIKGSEVLAVLEDLEKSGIPIFVCGTCLTHFNLMDEKQVGETTNMLDIVTSMQLADTVINI